MTVIDRITDQVKDSVRTIERATDRMINGTTDRMIARATEQ